MIDLPLAYGIRKADWHQYLSWFIRLFWLDSKIINTSYLDRKIELLQ